MDLIRFGLLGLGAGAIYALMGQGIVLVYRGSGVVNFAHGAYGMIGAFSFYLWRDGGMATPAALALALGLGAAMGAATHLLVMRPLRDAPALARLIATLGLLTFGIGFGLERWGDSPRIVAKLLPVDPVDLGADLVIGRDRLVLLGIAAGASAVLLVVYRWTRFGLATSAVAEDRRNTALLAVSPDAVATGNWALGSALAVAAAVLIVNVTGLHVVNLTLLVVPGLAAALVGQFRSFPLTLAGGLLIGVLESEVAYAQTKVSDPTLLQGWGRAVPFVVIIAVLTVRGQSLPLRTDAVERSPTIGDGRIAPVRASLVVIASVWLVSSVVSDRLVEAATTTATVAVIVLSLTVLTGYAGQLSLAQFALAGTGAWIAARLVVDHGLSSEVASIAGIALTVPIGLLVGLPALRTRGVNLAVVTIGLALVLESLVLNNSERTGGITGTQVGSPTFFGIDLDTTRHPERYAVLAILCLAAVALAVSNLRRGRVGRRLVAVRTNERAAAALGISVVGTKLYAFGLSAGIAAVGGILLALRRPTVVFYPTFSVFESILVIVYGVIGGIGFVWGAVLGALLAPGGLVVAVGGDLFDSAQTVQLVLGVLVIAVLLWRPDGLASIRGWLPRWLRPGEPVPWGEPAGDAARPRIEPASLAVEDLRVTFGGIRAVDGVTFRVEPGEVVGLIGPNGAGKSTVIDAVTGFTRASGTVRLREDDVGAWSPRRRAVAGLGRSFQHLELFDTMSVRENLLAAGDRRDRWGYLTDLVRPGRSRLGAAASAAVEEFDLGADLDRRPTELSYGRRRLVALARAVAAEPSVLLLDEPAAGLGTRDTAELGRLLRRLADEWGIAVLLVEHDVSLVLEVCDRVVVLDAGKKIAEGPPALVRGDEAVVAAYLGVDDVAPLNAASATGRAGVGAPVLAAAGLDAGYGQLAAVRGLDLEVREGEIVGLLGANGAGKTTTLLTLAGELPPIGGTVRWRGAPTSLPLHRRAALGTSLVPEHKGVIRGLTVGENLRLARVPAHAACALFPELDPMLGRRVALLSGGEQQMLSLAIALGRRPAVLLADELSLGLAPLVVDRLLQELRRAADDDGVAVLVVEQHVRRVLDVADRAVVLRRGVVALEGTPADLRAAGDELERAYLPG